VYYTNTPYDTSLQIKQIHKQVVVWTET